MQCGHYEEGQSGLSQKHEYLAKVVFNAGASDEDNLAEAEVVGQVGEKFPHHLANLDGQLSGGADDQGANLPLGQLKFL